MSPSLLVFTSVFTVSLLSLCGIVFFLFEEQLVRRSILPLVSFSTGALIGDVFIHIIPEIAESSTNLENNLLVVLIGLVCSFVIEKIIHWRHCHVMPDEECPTDNHHDHAHHHAHHHIGMMNLLGDGIHNFIDGALIAGSFLVSTQVGLATTIAVILHEIPQEIGDFAVLIHSGFSRKKAVFFNLLSALSSFVGASMILIFESAIPLLGSILLPLAAGNFLYIAGADLIPELHKETRIKQAFIQLATMICGILIMLLLTKFD